MSRLRPDIPRGKSYYDLIYRITQQKAPPMQVGGVWIRVDIDRNMGHELSMKRVSKCAKCGKRFSFERHEVRGCYPKRCTACKRGHRYARSPTTETTRLRGIHHNMISRCTDPNNIGYKWYGQKGVSVCQAWQDSFDVFAQDMGPRPTRQHELDRFPDQRGNYEPTNCRWATRKQNNLNRVSNRLIEHDGKKLALAEWATLTGISRETIASRLREGWSAARALTTPAQTAKHLLKPRKTKLAHLLTFRGATRTVAEWARRKGISADTIHHRLRRKWPVNNALFAPTDFYSR